jgi:hypothetical protein
MSKYKTDHVDYNYVKWLFNLQIGDKVEYTNGTKTWIEKFKYVDLGNGFWIKQYCTACGDTFGCRGESTLGEDEAVYLVKPKEITKKYKCIAICPELDIEHLPHCTFSEERIKDLDEYGREYCPCGNQTELIEVKL